MFLIRSIDVKNVDEIKRCLDIYSYYVESTCYSLELDAPSFEEFSSRVKDIAKEYPFLVYEEDGNIIAYAYLNKFSPRLGYKHTADLSIYVDSNRLKGGIGTELFYEILKIAKEKNIKNIISIITSENEGSIIFHTRRGFACRACLKGIAEKFGVVIDVFYFQYTIQW